MPVQTVRVLTLNVCGLASRNPRLPSLATRAVRFCRHLEESNVDVVNLQELFTRAGWSCSGRCCPRFRTWLGSAAWPAGPPVGW